MYHSLLKKANAYVSPKLNINLYFFQKLEFRSYLATNYSCIWILQKTGNNIIMLMKKRIKNMHNNNIMITKHEEYIIVSIGLFMGIKILNKEVKIQITKQINKYIL